MKRKGIRQRDQSDCGPACLAYIARFFGIRANVLFIRQWAKTNESGTSVQGLLKAAQRLHLRAEALRCDKQAFDTLSLPLIAHCELADGRWHFVTIEKRTEHSVVEMDPAIGDCIKVKKSDFFNRWTGVVIVVEPKVHPENVRHYATSQKLAKLIVPYSGVLTTVVACSVFYALCGLATSWYLQEIVDKILVKHDIQRLWTLSWLMYIVLAVQCAIAVLRSRLILMVSHKLDIHLITEFFGKLLQLPSALLGRMQRGDLLNRADDALRINRFIGDTLPVLIVDLLFMTFSLLPMVYYHPAFALMNIAMIPAFVLVYTQWDKIYDRLHRRVVAAAASSDAVMVEGIQSLSTTRLLQAETFVNNRIINKRKEYTSLAHKAGTINSSFEAFTEFITKGFCLSILSVGALFVISAKITAGQLIALYTLTGYFTLPALGVISSARKIRETTIAAERYFEIIDFTDTEDITVYSGNVAAAGEIKLEHIYFSYDDGKPILKDFCLTIKAGEVTGIKGVSGSGKSTLISLLCRIYKPDAGKITIAGVDIGALEQDSLRHLMAVVPQQVDLFAASLRENICLTLPFEEAWFDEVCQRAGVDEFCGPSSARLDLLIAEHGNNLSGGQKQKVAIARALYRRSPILLLDEPTSSMDGTSAIKIVQTIDWYKNLGNTVIIITHSDNALKICDNIVLL